jgi:CubicO group peptidase (beta-lactamase class C family)
MRLGLILVLCGTIFSCSQNQKAKEEKEEKPAEKQLTQDEIKKIRTEIKADKKSRLLAEAFEKREKSGFNGTILVAQKGIVLLEKATGFAHDTIPNTIDSKFQLASLSKTFTALCIMKLVQDGKVVLDNTVQDYYPGFPYSGITIRSLLSHRSGLPYYQYEFDRKVRDGKIYATNQQIMQWFQEANPKPKIMNQPDHYFAYNNTNYAVLGAIIEKVSGVSFAQYLDENICKPAGMSNTFAGNSTNPALNVNRTQGYQNGRKLQKDFYDDIMGDKGVYSTAPDLLKYYNILKSEKIITKENLREMYTPRSFEHPGIRNYGYGFRLWVNKLQQTDYIYHTGWWKGYNTIMFFDLREDFVVILLSNKYNRSVYNIREIVDIIHGDDKNSSLEDNILDQ